MAVLASSILTRASAVLHDAAQTRWPPAELLNWLNDGQVAIVEIDPRANTTTGTMLATAGTRQTAPADCIEILDVIRNMGASGTTPDTAITQTSRALMDAYEPGWHQAETTSGALHWMKDPHNRRIFYLYPPSNGSYQIEILFSATPLVIVATTNNITIPDQYAPALLDYVLFRAFSKDAEFAANLTRAGAHYQAFAAALGGNVPMAAEGQ